jgi:hypothetical protein
MADDSPDLEELAKVHPGIWMEHFGFILSKTRNLIRPALNVFQARAVAAYAWCLTNGIAPRLMGLKPRQVGGTTVFAGLSYHHGRRFNSKGISIADIMDRSSNLFQMVCRFASSDELDWGSGFYEPTKLELKLKNGSEFYKRSADTPTSGRSDTLQIVHASEVPYWKDTAVKSARESQARVTSCCAATARVFLLSMSRRARC